MVCGFTPCFSAIGACIAHSYCAFQCCAVHRMANSDSRGGTLVLKRRWLEFLRDFAECRRVQINRERPGHLELAARSRRWSLRASAARRSRYSRTWAGGAIACRPWCPLAALGGSSRRRKRLSVSGPTGSWRAWIAVSSALVLPVALLPALAFLTPFGLALVAAAAALRGISPAFSTCRTQ